MKPSDRFRFYTVPVVLALALSALAVRPAFAAGGPPPPSDTPLGVASPSSNSSSDASPTGQRAGSHQADGPGRHAPLARLKAAQNATTGDPVWCPAGIAPRALPTAGCSGHFANLLSLVSGFTPSLAANGVIWIESGADLSAGDVTINGLSWVTASTHALTLKGGWTGINFNSSTPGTTFLGKSLSVINWNGPVTMSNMAFVLANTNPNGFNNGQLLIQTSKSVSLNHVAAGASPTLRGAWIDSGGNVTIQNGNFNSNFNSNLVVFAQGAVTLKNVNAFYSTTNFGIYINNTSPASKNVVLTNIVVGNNHFDGLHVNSSGTITVHNLTAVSNGAPLFNPGVFLDNVVALSDRPVKLGGTNQIENNKGAGLVINSRGVIKISNLTASDNLGGDGVDINNTFGGDSSVILTGFNAFNNNKEAGLYILSDGPISLHNITAGHNGKPLTSQPGALLDNLASGVPHAITLTGINNFNDNNGTGLYVQSSGPFMASSVTASDNDNGPGVAINHASSVKFTGASTFANNYSGGLYVISIGAISLRNITANDNGAQGVNLSNAFPAGAAVSLTGTNVFLDNHSSGLYITSNGRITLSNVTAVGNGFVNASGPGVYLDNCHYNAPLTACIVPVRQPVIFKGTNLFKHNFGDGLRVRTLGAITLSNVTASRNTALGIELFADDNWDPTATPLSKVVYVAPLTIKGYISTSYNAEDGLYAATHGPITISNLTALFNGSSGAPGVDFNTHGYFGPGGTTVPSKVVLKGFTNISYNGDLVGANGGDGLDILNDGSITISNLTADGNAESGAFLDNYQFWHNSPFPTPTLKLLGVNSLSDNGSRGLWFLTPGPVYLSHVTASYNKSNGIELLGPGVEPSSITLVCGTMFANTGAGLILKTPGTLSLLGTLSFSNGSADTLTGALHVTPACP